MIFDINFLSEVKTSYDDDLGRAEEQVKLLKERKKRKEVAIIPGSYCYANNQKICGFDTQTE